MRPPSEDCSIVSLHLDGPEGDDDDDDEVMIEEPSRDMEEVLSDDEITILEGPEALRNSSGGVQKKKRRQADPSNPSTTEPGSSRPRRKTTKVVDYVETGRRSGTTVSSNPSSTAGQQEERCPACKQMVAHASSVDLNELPPGCVETALLQDPGLQIQGAEEAQFRLQNFMVFDKFGHLVSIISDTASPEKVPLFFSGQVMHLTGITQHSEEQLEEYSVHVRKSGRITGYYHEMQDPDQSEVTLMLTTELDGQPVTYYLREPHSLYEPLYRDAYKFYFMVVNVIKRLYDQVESCEYEDLVDFCNNLDEPQLGTENLGPIDEDYILNNASQLAQHIYSYQLGADPDELDICTLPAVERLFRIANFREQPRSPVVNHQQRGRPSKRRQLRNNNQPDADQGKTYTTPLIKSLFGHYFREQLTAAEDMVHGLYKACGTCVNCKRDSCGSCDQCRLMEGYGGSAPNGTYVCCERQCLNSGHPHLVGVADDDDDLPAEERVRVRWEGECCRVIVKSGGRMLRVYPAAQLVTVLADTALHQLHGGGEKIVRTVLRPGSFILLNHDTGVANLPYQVGRIIYLCDVDNGDQAGSSKHAHVQMFTLSTATTLGWMGNPDERFALAHCVSVPLAHVVRTLDMEHRSVADTSVWRERGGTEQAEHNGGGGGDTSGNGGGRTFWRLQYNPSTGSFEYPEEGGNLPVDAEGGCTLCAGPMARQKAEGTFQLTLDPERQVVVASPELELSVGQFFYLEDVAAAGLRMSSSRPRPVTLPQTFYRKQEVRKCELGPSVWDPFIVVQLRQVEPDRVLLAPFYRPQNTHLEYEKTRGHDLSVLFATQQTSWVTRDQLAANIVTQGQPDVAYGPPDRQDDLVAWTDGAEDRFYVSEIYERRYKRFRRLTEEEVASLAIPLFSERASIPQPASLSQPLRMMDLCSGAGGLSNGLEMSGVATARWAIETWADAAEAFKMNHPQAKVYNEDCSLLLKRIMEGLDGPAKGDVDIIVGGPPCQGFSLLNKHRQTHSARLKNSVVAAFLSYCDYYRPRYVLMENVAALASHDTGIVLKLVLSSLVQMGYQVGFSHLQAGHFGVPQSRKRLFIMAAAPGERLPAFPTPQYVSDGKHFDIFTIDGRTYRPDERRLRSGAPRRCITVWDAFSDLPTISSGHMVDKMAYKTRPLSHLQRWYYRGELRHTDQLVDHIVRETDELNQARFNHVPTTPFSNWQDLPNIELTLPSGQQVPKLVYGYYATKESRCLDSICQCSLSSARGQRTKVACNYKECMPRDTLIPPFAAHTFWKNNNYPDAYGRVPYNGTFRTIITSASPSSTQGRVLHPHQHRICSVREFARAQGFRDSFKLYGIIASKIKQVGNAVPPPMGRAIGMEIRKSLQNPRPIVLD